MGVNLFEEYSFRRFSGWLKKKKTIEKERKQEEQLKNIYSCSGMKDGFISEKMVVVEMKRSGWLYILEVELTDS